MAERVQTRKGKNVHTAEDINNDNLLTPDEIWPGSRKRGGRGNGGPCDLGRRIASNSVSLRAVGFYNCVVNDTRGRPLVYTASRGRGASI